MEKKKSSRSLEELVKYSKAGLAATLANPQEAIYAISSFYKDLGLEEDPIIASAISRSKHEIEEKGVSLMNTEIGASIAHYSEKYKKALAEVTIGELLQLAEQSGCSIPEEVKAQLRKYAGLTYSELAGHVKEGRKVTARIEQLSKQLEEEREEKDYIDKKKLEELAALYAKTIEGKIYAKALEAISLIEQQRLEKLRHRIATEYIEKRLKELYPKAEKKEEAAGAARTAGTAEEAIASTEQ